MKHFSFEFLPRKQKKLLFASLTLTLSAFLLTSCGNATKNNTSSFTESTSAVAESEESTHKYTNTDMAMGTVVSQILYTSGEDLSEENLAILTALEETLISWRVEESEIYQINQNAGNPEGTEVSEKTLEYIKTALQLSADSEGAMDPTLGNVVRLWDIDGENPKVPEASELNALLTSVGYENISIVDNKVVLEKNSSLDFGSLGKGIGIDEIYSLLENHKEITGAVISIGGSSILTYGEKEDGSSWKVALTDPRSETAEYLGSLELEGTNFISTSGDYEKYFMEDGIRYHHILAPSTGYPSDSGIIDVTVVCKSGMLSDGLSTACMVLGLEKGQELLEKYGAEGIFVTSDKEIYVTGGLKGKLDVTAEGYTFLEK